MHVLRTTVFSSLADSLTLVVRESDVVSFSEVLGGRQPTEFVAHEVFEMHDADIQVATIAAMARRTDDQALREHHMAMSFFWNGSALGMVKAGGVLHNDKPAPLSKDEIRQVLIQLATHPHYNNQTVICVSEDGKTVMLANGELREED